jgi:aryl-alcohol dehydrogenase-like predicted oxidoreductase
MAIMTRPLGATGADVTILGYGAMELRGRPRGPEIPADTPPPYPHDYSPGNVRADVEQSLRRLRTDRLDLVQVHMSPGKATLEENHTVETLRDLQAEGKVRFIGMSGILPNLPDHIAMGVFDVFQIPYSAVQRDHEELITEAADAGAGNFIRGGAARGAVSADKTWRTRPLSQDPGVGQRNWETSGIAGLLSEAGMGNMEFVLRFTLSHPGLSTTIVGTSNPAHLASNMAFAERGPLPADLYEKAKKRLPLPERKPGKPQDAGAVPARRVPAASLISDGVRAAMAWTTGSGPGRAVMIRTMASSSPALSRANTAGAGPAGP